MSEVYELGQFLQPWGWLLSLTFTGLVVLFGMAIRGQMVTRQELDEREKSAKAAAELHAALHEKEAEHYAALAQRVERHDQRLADLPTKDEVHELELHIIRLEGTINTLGERLAGFGAIVERAEKVVDRQEAYFMRQGGRS